MAVLESVNLGRPRPNPFKKTEEDRDRQEPAPGPVEVRDPGRSGLGSGLVGDFIGDGKHHGGHDQAVYAFQREDLDRWEQRLGQDLPNGFFGENLTTFGLEVNEARVGERWRVGAEVELVVTGPRIPCSTFRGWVGEKGWVKLFAADARSGAYLRVVRPGTIQAGDPIEVLHRPDHDVTVSLFFRSQMAERDLLPRLLAAGDDLPVDTREDVERFLAKGRPRSE